MILFINMTLHLPLRSPPHMKKNIGSNLFFNTEHVAHIFTLLHYFMILLPTQHRFYISFFRTSYTLHIYITFSFLPLFICILQKIIVDLAFRHALDVGCPCWLILRVSMNHPSSLIPTIPPRSSSAFKYFHYVFFTWYLSHPRPDICLSSSETLLEYDLPLIT